MVILHQLDIKGVKKERKMYTKVSFVILETYAL